eukprot:TRINITY_DN4987_c1_g1_i4.p1 TRINITY_DN4987_c1_g1~~TRINITY_DN4987_c1_g1_i4.p1  ORF type:complete len:777 (+),score=197.18 TRINITY_DN4987_c1_g1_i4:61-2391(+)
MKKRIELSLLTARQSALERMGVVETTSATTAVGEKNTNLKLNKSYLEDLVKIFDIQLTALDNSVGAGRHLVENFTKWDTTFQDRGTQQSRTGKYVRNSINYQSELTALESKLRTSLHERVADPTRVFLEQIGYARDAKKKLTKKRKTCDALEARYHNTIKNTKNAQKIEEAKTELTTLQDEYHRLERDTTELLASTLQRSEATLLERLGWYWSAHYTHYKECLKLMEDMKAIMDPILAAGGGSGSFGPATTTTTASSTASKGGPATTNTTTTNATAATAATTTSSSSSLSSFPSSAPPPVPVPMQVDTPVDPRKCFGVPLAALWQREGGCFPQHIGDIFAYLVEFGPSEEGVFKMRGVKSQTDKMRDNIDKGMPMGGGSGVVSDTASVADLLLLWLDKMPEPVGTFSLYNDFASAIGTTGELGQVSLLGRIVPKLPLPNRVLLWLLVNMCGCIVSAQSGSKKDDRKFVNDLAIDLAVEIGPKVFKAQGAEGSTDVQAAVTCFKVLILHSLTIFPDKCEEERVFYAGLERKDAERNQTASTAPQPSSSASSATAAAATASSPPTPTSSSSPQDPRPTGAPMTKQESIPKVQTPTLASAPVPTAATPSNVKQAEVASPSLAASSPGPLPARTPKAKATTMAELQGAKSTDKEVWTPVFNHAETVILLLEDLKYAGVRVKSPEAGAPMLMLLKTVMPEAEKIKAMLRTVPPPLDRSILSSVPVEDKLTRAHKAVEIFGGDMQIYLRALKADCKAFSEAELAEARTILASMAASLSSLKV